MRTTVPFLRKAFLLQHVALMGCRTRALCTLHKLCPRLAARCSASLALLASTSTSTSRVLCAFIHVMPCAAAGIRLTMPRGPSHGSPQRRQVFHCFATSDVISQPALYFLILFGVRITAVSALPPRRRSTPTPSCWDACDQRKHVTWEDGVHAAVWVDSWKALESALLGTRF